MPSIPHKGLSRAFLVPAVLASATAAALPEVPEPEFTFSHEVTHSIDRMLDAMEAAPADVERARLAQALGVCREARAAIVLFVNARSYHLELGRLNWRRCHDAYRSLP